MLPATQPFPFARPLTANFGENESGDNKRSSTVTRLCAGAVLLGGLASCGSDVSHVSDRFDIKLPVPDVVISLESELIAGPSGMAIDSTGRLWVADFQGKRLVSVRPDGSDAIVVGREGRGPGEFGGPLGIIAGPAWVRTAEAFNNRFQDYALDGTHLVDHSPAVPNIGAAAMREDGLFVVPVPADSLLAALHRLGGTVTVRFGEPVVPTALYRNPNAQLADARAGIVPDEVRNFLLPAVGVNAVYLVMMAEAEVRKYDLRGALLWRTTLDVPEVANVREQYFAAARDTAARGSGVLMALTQGMEVGGAFWVLVNQQPGDPAVFYVLDRQTGVVSGRMTLQVPAPALKFAVDRRGRRLYVSIPDEATVVATEIGDVPDIYRE